MSKLRRLTYNICTCAISLLTIWFISACNASDETTLSDVSQSVVSVDVALGISGYQTPPHASAATRMSAEAVQTPSSTFRGIQNIRLIPFKTEGEIQRDDAPLTPFNVPTGEPYTEEDNRHYYHKTADLLKGTASFLCYGTPQEVTPKTGDKVIDSKFLNGFVKCDYSDYSPKNITFSPVPIRTEDDGKGSAIADYLTGIAKAGNWNASGDEILNAIFKEFVNNDHGEFHPFAGSSTNVKKWVNKLYTKFETIHAEELLTVKAAVQAAIANTQYVTFDADRKEVTSLNDMEGHPTNLPDGAAVIRWNNAADGKFEYQTTEPNRLEQYAYPAELLYHVNSTLRTSRESQKPLYAHDKKWEDILAAYADGTAVEEGTRSVALEKPLHYGVGCLKTMIKAAPIKQNDKKGFLDLDGALVPVGDTGDGKFPLTAILIGGQTKQDYTLSPLHPDEAAADYEAANDPEYIIYDKSIANEGICLGNFQGRDFSTPVYTLALQTKDDKSVKMVLEFENNSGVDFKCENGVIYDGTKFYMVAAIESSEAGKDYGKRVFTKDYMTTAQLTISSLDKAYNALPNLNSDKIRLFTTVEAGVKQWSTGQEDPHEVYNW